MPIVIREIEISVEVNDHKPVNSDTPTTGQSVNEDIIKVCVEKVMEIINQKNER